MLCRLRFYAKIIKKEVMAKHFVSNKDESARIFKSDFLEFFSKVHWLTPIALYAPFVIYLLYYSFARVGFWNPIGLFGAGLFFWTFTEYVLHRFVFHYEPMRDWARRAHWTFHGVHHDYPQDSKRLVMPPAVSLPLAALFYVLFDSLLGFYTPPFLAGFLTGYVAYDTLHYALHHFSFKSGAMLELKKHHMKHHYSDPQQGFGVSSALWDFAFGTFSGEKKMRQAREEADKD